MTAPDMDVIKEIPGYKVILKAILKSQIQQLVEQLASHTNEESIILTASISDGTLSHLGSDSGKFFLEDHEDIKSQFLGFCLKHHHRKKEKEKQDQELQQQQEEAQRRQERQMQMMSQHPRFGPRPGFMSRSPRFAPRFSPRQPMRSPGMRHEPYPVTRPMKRPLNFDPAGPGNGHMRLPIGGGVVDNKVIKIEMDDPDSNQSAGDSNVPSASGEIPSGDESNKASSSQPSSPSHTSVPSSNLKIEHGDKDDDAKSESSSTSAAQASERRSSDIGTLDTGLSLDSDLSNLISGEPSSTAADNLEGGGTTPQTPTDTSDVDPNVNIKLEAITESEMELEITGVEPGRSMEPGRSAVNPGMGSQHDAGASWSPAMQGAMGAMGFDPSDIAGNQSGMMAADQGYNKLRNADSYHGVGLAEFGVPDKLKNADSYHGVGLAEFGVLPRYFCDLCNKSFPTNWELKRHYRTHTGERPYKCDYCYRTFTVRGNMNVHIRKAHGQE